MTLFVEFYYFLAISGEIVVEIWRTRQLLPRPIRIYHSVFEFVGTRYLSPCPIRLEARAIVTLNSIVIAPIICIGLTDSFNIMYPTTIATNGSIFRSRDVFVEPISDMQ